MALVPSFDDFAKAYDAGKNQVVFNGLQLI